MPPCFFTVACFTLIFMGPTVFRAEIKGFYPKSASNLELWFSVLLLVPSFLASLLLRGVHRNKNEANLPAMPEAHAGQAGNARPTKQVRLNIGRLIFQVQNPAELIVQATRTYK